MSTRTFFFKMPLSEKRKNLAVHRLCFKYLLRLIVISMQFVKSVMVSITLFYILLITASIMMSGDDRNNIDAKQDFTPPSAHPNFCVINCSNTVLLFIYFLHKLYGLGKITLRHGCNTPYIACPDKLGHNTSLISNTQSV